MGSDIERQKKTIACQLSRGLVLAARPISGIATFIRSGWMVGLTHASQKKIF